MAGLAPLPPSDDSAEDLKAARAVARGICRLFARNDIWCLAEMPLRSGRRAGNAWQQPAVVEELKVIAAIDHRQAEIAAGRHFDAGKVPMTAWALVD